MARSNLLTCLEKRDLLNQAAVSVDKLTDFGERYEESGMLNDAVDFYEKASAVEPLERLLLAAREQGDAFLYGRILRALDREAPKEEWIAVGEKAQELGKLAYAREAFKRGGREMGEVEKV